MNLITFISDPGRRAALAEKVGTSPAYLWQLATAWQPKGGRPKRASAELANLIEAATREIGPEPVLRETLRPDIFGAQAVTLPAREVA